MAKHMPYGYTIQNGKIIMDEGKTEVIRFIFKEYLAGASVHKLTHRLEEKGYLNAYGKPSWCHGPVGRILENPVYMGNQYYSPLITQVDFEQVQELRHNKRKELGRFIAEEDEAEKKLFYGILFCSFCGSGFSHYRIWERKGAARIRWKCKRYYSLKSCVCDSKITSEQLMGATIEVLNQLIEHPAWIKNREQVPEVLKSKEWRLLDRRIQAVQTGSEGKKISDRELVSLALQRAAERYSTIEVNDTPVMTEKMQMMFEGRTKMAELDEELYRKSIKRIWVKGNRILRFEFINGMNVEIIY